MGVLTSDMQRVVGEQRLGYVATVCPDGTPSLSPKGTVAVWDDDRLFFADIRSPQTVRNLRSNPAIEINVVDPLVRKGYRFKGKATLHAEGPVFDEGVRRCRDRGVASPIRTIVLIQVEKAAALISPVYETGVSEAEVRSRWEAYWRGLPAEREPTAAPPSLGE